MYYTSFYMLHFSPEARTPLAASVAVLQRYWRVKKALIAPAASTALVNRLDQDITAAVSFEFKTEPTVIADWREVYAVAAALASRHELRLPAAVVLFEFLVPSARGPLACACVGRQTEGYWLSYVFLEAVLQPIYMLHFPDRMIRPELPSALVWLEDGRDAWPDANAFLARRGTRQPPTREQCIADLAVQAGELLLYLAVADRQQRTDVCRAARKLG